ncbi:HAMP domain-containing sensor histidine kinase [uncultured Clostridium sp.]|uniref:HAMP domain-containing sensor histidine kinase n=1 Tax=uncultured Clostridium sp. TaxID=59620 RepID=UPI0028EE9FD4|nr:HAMP domain-containing sensor histidine kinase [uncultured Clostridium sp.]
MKKKFRFKFKSIYDKFTIIFLSVWWMLNFLTFGAIMHVMANSPLVRLAPQFIEMSAEFHKVRVLTGFSFFVSSCLGTVVILFVVRGIVKPIKQLSAASKEVAKGNFDISVNTNSNDEVGQLATDFNTMVQELKSIDLLRKEFVSNVSHEFRTPITSIKGFAKLIRDDRLTEEQRLEYSDIIVDESERLTQLSSNMLRLSELDSQVIREELSRFSLDEQIRKTILILESQWTKKNIIFDLDLEEIEYTGEEDLLRQVWLNLIQNAIKFSNDGDLISITLHHQNDIFITTIADNGEGIAEEDKDRVFDRFYRSNKFRNKEGNGLGLVIAKRIVEISGGRIYFESEQNKGTKFTVELPSV